MNLCSYMLTMGIRIVVLLFLVALVYGPHQQAGSLVVPNPTPVIALLLWYGYELCCFAVGSLKRCFASR